MTTRLRRSLALARLLGTMLLALGLAYVAPIVWSALAADGALNSLLIGAALTLITGGLLRGVAHRHRADLSARDGCLLIVLTVLALAAAAAIPFHLHAHGLHDAMGANPTDALFEALSALTTTGATRLAGVEALPVSLNVWRHLLQWLGGMGIIVLSVAILPWLGVGGMQLFRADTPGPMREARLAPRMAQTARYLWSVYLGLTLACFLALKMAGMGWFDALCHALSTMSLGGFSTRDANIGAWDSPAIEAVMMVFMVLAALNFTSHFLALRHRGLAAWRRDTEAVWVLAAIVLSVALLTGVVSWADISAGTGADMPYTVRTVAFATVSNATTGGFYAISPVAWPPFAGLWLLLLCAVVASSGSTGGGIKMIRTLILLKQTLRELLRMSHPRAVRPLMLGAHVIAPPLVLAVLGFMLLYGVTLLGLTLLLVLTGLDASAAISAVMACLNNNGGGLVPTGMLPDFRTLTDFQAWILGFAMLAGRLELLIVFVLATPSFWRR
jgi:trk system potassium uptake protein TrkH